MSRLWRRIFGLSPIFCGLLCSAVWADVGVLRSAAPGDGGLYLEIENVAATWEKAQNDPFTERLDAFPPIARWKALGQPAVRFTVDQISRQLGLEPQQLQHDVFGGSILLGLWPEMRGERFEPGLLLLIEAPNGDVLLEAVRGWNVASRRSGELKGLETRQHAGRDYWMRRVRRDGVEVEEFAAVVGKIGLASNREALIRGCLEKIQPVGAAPAVDAPAGSLAQAPWMKTALVDSASSVDLRVTMNPTPWRPLAAEALRRSVEEDPNSAPAAAAVRGLLDAMESVWLTGAVEEGLRLEAAVRIDPRKLTPDWNDQIAALCGPATLPPGTPRNALTAAAGRFDPRPLLALTLRLAGEKEQVELSKLRSVVNAALQGVDLFDDVLPNLGPRWGMYLAPPRETVGGAAVENTASGAESETRPAAVELAAAVEFRDVPSGKAGAPKSSAAVHQALRMMLTFFAVADRGEHPGSSALARSAERAEGRVDWVQGLTDLPAVVSPSVAFSQGMFLVGSSPEALWNALEKSSTEDSLLVDLNSRLSSRMSQPSHWWWVNFRETRRFIDQRRDMLVARVAEAKGAPEEPVRRGLSQLESLLGLADDLLIAVQFQPDRCHVHVRLSAGRPTP